MKKSLIGGLGVVVLLCCVYACQDNLLSRPTELQSFSKDFENYQGESSQGEVTIKSNARNEITIFLENDNKNGNLAEKAYVLQLDKLPHSFDVKLKKAQIGFLGRLIIINSLSSKERYFFQLNGTETKSLLTKFSKEYSDYVTDDVSGYGLSRFSVQDGYVLDVKSFNSGTSYANAKIAISCNSGGAGSSSCSCCGCSVTCAAGYYSCCNPELVAKDPGCKCKPN